MFHFKINTWRVVLVTAKLQVSDISHFWANISSCLRSLSKFLTPLGSLSEYLSHMGSFKQYLSHFRSFSKCLSNLKRVNAYHIWNLSLLNLRSLRKFLAHVGSLSNSEWLYLSRNLSKYLLNLRSLSKCLSHMVCLSIC